MQQHECRSPWAVTVKSHDSVPSPSSALDGGWSTCHAWRMNLGFKTRLCRALRMHRRAKSKAFFLSFVASLLACGGKAATSVSNESGAGGVEPTAGGGEDGGVEPTAGGGEAGGVEPTANPGGAAGDGGSGAQPSGGGPIDVAGGAGECGGQHTTPNPNSGRPAAIACPATSLSDSGLDGGIVPCKSDADCSGTDSVRFCFGGVCGSDQCRADSDCGKGNACACLGEALGTLGGNECVPAQCRINSDCGPNGVCAPSFSDPCGLRVDGYHCRSVAATCNDSGDCCKNSPSCLFQPASGHWSCQPRPVCIAG
jgi:hypothetical protein